MPDEDSWKRMSFGRKVWREVVDRGKGLCGDGMFEVGTWKKSRLRTPSSDDLDYDSALFAATCPLAFVPRNPTDSTFIYDA